MAKRGRRAGAGPGRCCRSRKPRTLRPQRRVAQPRRRSAPADRPRAGAPAGCRRSRPASASRSGHRRRPAAARSRARRADRGARRRAGAGPSSDGPSGVSIVARKAADRLARCSPSSSGAARALAAMRARRARPSRSAAAKSVASNTRWTKVPTSTPAGSRPPAARSARDPRPGPTPVRSSRAVARRPRARRRAAAPPARSPRARRAPGGDVAVGGAPPAQVEAAVEAGGGELRRRLERRAVHARRHPERRALDADPPGRPSGELVEALGRDVGVGRASAAPSGRRCRRRRGRTAGGRAASCRLFQDARPPDHRLMPGSGQRDIGQAQVLAALLDRCWRDVARERAVRQPHVERVRASPAAGSWKNDRPRLSGSTSGPRGTGSRRSGTRGPCCDGWSAPGPPRRRSRAGGCAPRRRSSRLASAIRSAQPRRQRGDPQPLGARRGGAAAARRDAGR